MTTEDVLQWDDENEPFTYEYTGYNDRPLSGRAILKASGDRFAWICDEIFENRLWHWIFVEMRSEDRRQEVREFVKGLRGTSDVRWMSVLEDRRARRARFTGVWMDGPFDDDL